ncbi:hypothetical protein C7455_10873 [Roseicyclus mahoneyensis]|uniref:Sulfotransferase family protein n=2 Tax=Roseicyclus mahoneyensis TaxID=164332 RepID=A0A316GGN0_9RHOB|nr:hypothetical protein C7455_10873 [Roseicyclus mahoneyensis]
MVLVCNDPKFIFLKTKKTAGTSVEMLLEPFCAPEGHAVLEKVDVIVSDRGIIGSRLKGAQLPDELSKIYGLWHNHKPAAMVQQLVGMIKWRQSTKITTVRNPFDRMVSMFHYGHRNAPFLGGDFDGIRKNFQTWIVSGRWDADESIVTIDGKLCVDFIVRFENLRDDLKSLGAQLGVDIAVDSLPHTKSMAATRRYEVRDYYDEDSVKMVVERHKWVFDNCDYANEPQ